MDEELKECWYKVREMLVGHKMDYYHLDHELIKAIEKFDESLVKRNLVELGY